MRWLITRAKRQNGEGSLPHLRLHYVAEVVRRTGLSYAGILRAIYRDRVYTIPGVGFMASRICR